MLGEASRERKWLGKGSLSTGPRDNFYRKLVQSLNWKKRAKARASAGPAQPSPALSCVETRSKASVEERPLQDNPCSVPVPSDQPWRKVTIL